MAGRNLRVLLNIYLQPTYRVFQKYSVEKNKYPRPES
ncbi:MAG: hypothetical protein QOE55_7320 [Acidobacteriaceae bacterium]|jgi:hypothetical protein|nr:hypothetical protein [Acidobacteriaceae bacterium]